MDTRPWNANRFQRLHDVILFYSKADGHHFNALYDPYTDKSFKRKQNYDTRIKNGDVYAVGALRRHGWRSR